MKKHLMTVSAALVFLAAMAAEPQTLGIVSDFEGERADLSYWSGWNDGDVVTETGNSYLSVISSEGYARYIDEVSRKTAYDVAEENGERAGILFDTRMQFTATKTRPTVDENDKIVLWLKEKTSTRFALMVTAGYLKTEEGLLGDVKDYELALPEGVTIKPNEWHRLTVTVGTIDAFGFIAGFKISLDGGAPLTSTTKIADTAFTAFGDFYEAGCTFPSLLQDNTLSFARFTGEGAVDDLSFAELPIETPAEMTIDRPVATSAEPIEWTGDEIIGVTVDNDALGIAYTMDEYARVKATDPGEYSAVFTLLDGYTWSDGGSEAVTINWSIVKPEPKDWPAGDDPAIAGLTAAEAFAGKVPAALNEVPAGNFAVWAKKAEIDFVEPKVDDSWVEAYLFDCTLDEVETARAEFVIDDIFYDETAGEWVVTVKKGEGSVGEGEEYTVNAVVEIVDVTGLFVEGVDVTADEAAGFFKATLKPIVVESVRVE